MTFALLAVVRFIALRFAASTALVDIPELLKSSTTYVARRAWLVGKTLLVQISPPVLLAVIFSGLRSSGANAIHEADAWHALGELLAKPGQMVWASVRPKNGSEVMGYYFGASTELDPGKRELFIRAPLSFRADDEKQALALDETGQLMTIPGSEIAYIAAACVSDGKNPHQFNGEERRLIGYAGTI